MNECSVFIRIADLVLSRVTCGKEDRSLDILGSAGVVSIGISVKHNRR